MEATNLEEKHMDTGPAWEPSDKDLQDAMDLSEEDLDEDGEKMDKPVAASEDRRLKGGLSFIMDSISEYPVLSKEDEARYAKILKYGSEPEKKEAKEAFVLHNLRLVMSIAIKYQRVPRVSIEDLFQTGVIGLMRATDTYDIERGTKFSTYATFWVRQAIDRYIADHSSTIRIPVHVHEKIRIMRQIESQYGKMSIAELAKKMGVPESKIIELKNRPLVISLNSLIDPSENNDTELEELVGDPNAVDPELEYEKQNRRQVIDSLLGRLDPRERNIIIWRFGLDGDPPKTLEEIGAVIGITRERVRQIEAKAIRKLKSPKYIRIIQDLINLDN